MTNATIIDYSNKIVRTETKSDGVFINIKESDDTIIQCIGFTYDELFKIVDDVQRQLGEPTIGELEDQIIKQQSEIEELKEIIEVKEQFEELRGQQIDEHEVF